MRETFAKTNGDPVATLAVFPRSDALGRERTVLQGLKRYGKDKPLEAIRCLHFNIRLLWINNKSVGLFALGLFVIARHLCIVFSVTTLIYKKYVANRSDFSLYCSSYLSVRSNDNMTCCLLERSVPVKCS